MSSLFIYRHGEEAVHRICIFQYEYRSVVPVLDVIRSFFGRGFPGSHLLAHRLACGCGQGGNDHQVEFDAHSCARIQTCENPLSHGGKLSGWFFRIDHLILAYKNVVCLSKLCTYEACAATRTCNKSDNLAKHTDEPFVFRAGGFHGDWPRTGISPSG